MTTPSELDPKPATEATRLANAQVLRDLPFDDTFDFELISRGLVAPLIDGGLVKGDKGQFVFSYDAYGFADGDAPDTVNPSLWRQATLMGKGGGLFKLADRLYQVIGQDLSNTTIIEGDTGLIIGDTLMSAETAALALELYYQHRPKVPVKAIIFTHSHGDHFGGVKGFVTDEEIESGAVKVYAPDSFTEEAISENVLAGTAMTRRGMYMYGSFLRPGPQGQVSGGLGLSTSHGTSTFAVPTDVITEPVHEEVIDGVRVTFMLAPGTEAPSEMLFYLPDFKALGSAEDVTHTMHNLYTLRGAKTRDAKAWSHYVRLAMELFPDVEIIFAQHHWPTWGNDKILKLMSDQADLYKYLHDQTLRLANKGLTPVEIADQIEVPDAIGKQWYNRGYYGSLSHNVKAIYTFYLGWFDGVPAHLNPHPPVENGKRYVEAVGGPDALLTKGKQAFDDGDYRWAAELVNHLVFADPSNQKARELLADTYEQLGYQAENGTWRNFYLVGAMELRHPLAPMPSNNPTGPAVVAVMPLEQMLDFWAVRLDGPKAADVDLSLRFVLSDTADNVLVTVRNGVLNYDMDKADASAALTLTLTRAVFNEVYLGTTSLTESIKAGTAKAVGDQSELETFISLLEDFDLWFDIVTP
ncbi:alkyl sulfatase dimerization domain-containing protein [Rhodococcus qingshengii]|uniref:Linear primary-alkylsulfatase n=1 Tax=Rhodococcus qingshengii TaxID=334542 RepID=A0AAW6LEW7_RHOSG|nr:MULTISPECIES: alkyl sulfatase dimerization domain-containing protein [Rhodococcus]MBQ7808676.1 MBL fold metallo-hydrolase [Rhodococcus sp. (in: high G+C Gram-positive bacteria)]MDE8643861.1 alkyl sulfatase dimerization domain-containing protein [Rhodococcus qingshengii]